MPPCKTPTLLMRPFFLKYCLHLGHFRDKKKTRAKEARRLLRKAAPKHRAAVLPLLAHDSQLRLAFYLPSFLRPVSCWPHHGRRDSVAGDGNQSLPDACLLPALPPFG